MNCLTAKACGRWLPLLSITLQGCTSFRHLTFHSVHCLPPASATHARVLPSFHCAHANPPYHSAPLWLFHPTFRNSKPKREAAFHPILFAHFIQTPPLLCPTQSAVCPAKCSPLKTKSHKAPPPFKGAGKNRGSFAQSLMLEADSSHLFNRSVRTSLHYFILSPHPLQHRTCKCFVPHHLHLSPPTTTSFLLIFTCELFAP